MCDPVGAGGFSFIFILLSFQNKHTEKPSLRWQTDNPLSPPHLLHPQELYQDILEINKFILTVKDSNSVEVYKVKNESLTPTSPV